MHNGSSELLHSGMFKLELFRRAYSVLRSNGYGLFVGVAVGNAGPYAYRDQIRALRIEVDGRAHRLAAELWASPLVVAAVPVVWFFHHGVVEITGASRYAAIYPDLFKAISAARSPSTDPPWDTPSAP